jgi:hypothetical protein
MRNRTRLLLRSIAVLLVTTLACIAQAPRAACAIAQNTDQPSPDALREGLLALRSHRTEIRDAARWTLIDYDLPFTSVRLWVLDARHDNKVLMSSRVSHAWNSGLLFATKFSNVPGSELSSLGSFVTAARPYDGGYGRSLRVRGLDRGENDNALRRAIIFHPDLGMTHSAGCFMLPNDDAGRIVDAIAGGTFVYVHGPRS